MDGLDFLNSLATETEAAESGNFVQHPCGTFQGVIVKIDQKTMDGKPVWELFIKTAHGQANHNRWGFSSQDMQEAQTSQDARERMLKNIAMHKRLFVDCGVWKRGEEKSKTWNDILSSWKYLINKPCEVVVKPNQKKQGYIVTFINAHRQNEPDIVDQIQPPSPAPKGSNNSQQAPRTPPAGVTNRQPPGMGSNLNDIPF